MYGNEKINQHLWYFNPKKLPNELHEKTVFALTHLFFLKKKKKVPSTGKHFLVPKKGNTGKMNFTWQMS